MGILGSIWCIGLGVMGLFDASQVVIKRVPAAPVPPGYPPPPASGGAIAWGVVLIHFGVISGLWGLWGLLYGVLHLGFLEHYPLLWSAYLLSSLCNLTLGVTLLVSAIKTLARKPIQSGGALLYIRILAIATIAVGVLVMIANLLQL